MSTLVLVIIKGVRDKFIFFGSLFIFNFLVFLSIAFAEEEIMFSHLVEYFSSNSWIQDFIMKSISFLKDYAEKVSLFKILIRPVQKRKKFIA